MLVIFLVDVLDKFHDLDVMSICCDPGLELQVLILDESNKIVKHLIELLLQ